MHFENEVQSQNANGAGSGSLLDFMDKVIEGRAKVDFSFEIDETFENQLYIAMT